MPGRDGDSSASQFAASFPARFADVLADARGTMEGISASAVNGDGLIPAEALQRIHEVYRLRVELEIETAGVLWRTAEVVCALTDAIEVLNRRRRPAPLPPGGWLGGVARGVVERRRARLAMQDDEERRDSRWPDLGAPLSSTDADDGPAALTTGNGRRLAPAWRRHADSETEAEAA